MPAYPRKEVGEPRNDMCSVVMGFFSSKTCHSHSKLLQTTDKRHFRYTPTLPEEKKQSKTINYEKKENICFRRSVPTSLSQIDTAISFTLVCSSETED